MATVLIADDDVLMRAILRDALKRAGHEVREAATGLDALKEAEEAPPDCVVLDVMMPTASGIEVCREIRRTAPDTRIVIVSGRAGDADRRAGMDAGADLYVTKPFDPGRVAQLVGRLCRSRSARA
ncbi:MAG: response regulator [Actinomycetota bacterium]